MRIYIVGAGCGDKSTLTFDAVKAISSCKILIGAERLVKEYSSDKKVFSEYKAEIIKEIIDRNGEDTAVLMSGDTGFYSGAKKLSDILKNYEVEIIPGISSVSYFSSKVSMPWEDWKLVSTHGVNTNIIGYAKENKRTFAILNNGKDVNVLCKKLLYYGMENVILYVGENLSYHNERIISGTPMDLADIEFDNLTVCLIINNTAGRLIGDIKDDDFVRGSVPMTKEEVRSVSISKLGIKEASVFYDIGAGTGSVSISVALKSPDIKVYSFEKNPDALVLIEKNKAKFGADNVEIISGEALDNLDSFEKPSHAFIGGGGGNLDKIIEKLKKINCEIKIVINTVTLESLCQVQNIITKYGFEAEITQVSVAKGKRLGIHTLMKASNPVYIISL